MKKEEKWVIGITSIVDLIIILVGIAVTTFSSSLSSEIHRDIVIGIVTFLMGTYIFVVTALNEYCDLGYHTTEKHKMKKEEKTIISITVIVDLIIILLGSAVIMFSTSSKIQNNVFLYMIIFILASYMVLVVTPDDNCDNGY